MAKVMLFEDDQMMVGLLRTLLEMEGYQVVHMNPSANLLDWIQSEKPDIILMDVFMPELDGIETLRDIKAHQDLSGVSVIMTSGMELSAECEDAGADGFLLKPYNPSQLLDLLKEQVEGSRQDNPA